MMDEFMLVFEEIDPRGKCFLLFHFDYGLFIAEHKALRMEKGGRH